MPFPIGDCPYCRCEYRIKPDYAGGFMLACECPPAATFTTDNTAGSHSVQYQALVRARKAAQAS
jgi:hypothetical protein